MTFQLVDGNWEEEFHKAICDDASELRIICPFIKETPIQMLLDYHPRRVQVLTRFNLQDCAEMVSDVAALRRLLEANARVRGVQELHAKLYLFGKKRAIVTSCNLTQAALRSNHEIGMVTTDGPFIKRCLESFDKMWGKAGIDLEPYLVDEWDQRVNTFWLGGGRPDGRHGLRDCGTKIQPFEASPTQTPSPESPEQQAFVKFLGSSKKRLPLTDSTLDVIRYEGCHWSVCYPNNNRQKKVNDGDIIFMGRLTRNPTGITIFGRAVGMAYKEGRDNATEAEVEERSWREKYSRYIRVHHAEFVYGTLENGVSLYALIDELQFDSFASTQRKKREGKSDTNPKQAYSQQPHVLLSPEGFSWLSESLQLAFEKHGKVSQEELEKLDWPDSSAIAQLKY